MRVECEIASVELEGDYGPVDGICVTCSRCGHEVEAFGESGRSVRSCLARMREECPNGESNFYVVDDDDQE